MSYVNCANCGRSTENHAVCDTCFDSAMRACAEGKLVTKKRVADLEQQLDDMRAQIITISNAVKPGRSESVLDAVERVCGEATDFKLQHEEDRGLITHQAEVLLSLAKQRDDMRAQRDQHYVKLGKARSKIELLEGLLRVHAPDVVPRVDAALAALRIKPTDPPPPKTVDPKADEESAC